jgi:hypothetical protein
MTEPASDPIDLVAKAMAADLHALSDESQAAFRYLYARVALDEGLLELVGEDIRPDRSVRLVCREPNSGAVYAVERPGTWTTREDAEYVAQMRRHLNGA